jgi:DHA1 family inner membrane transport protein
MNLRREVLSLANAQVVFAMLISVVSSAGLFSVFTYITPILETVTRVSPHGVTLMLLIFGVGLTIGNIFGGRLADWKLMPSVIGLLATLVPILCLFGAVSTEKIPAAVALLVWGIVSFALIAPLQTRVVNMAVGAPNLASTINQGAFNLGNAIGAWAGGIALVHGVAYATLPWVGASFIAAALVLAVFAHWTDRRESLSSRNGVDRASTDDSTAQIVPRGTPAIPGVSS